MKKKRAALYLRSSKDRSDVSIDAQRRELTALAESRGLRIAHEYADVVKSAKTADRAGFQRLLLDLKNQDRGWSILLTVDTSRLSRRRYWAQAFKHEAAKRGVIILYSKVPDVDPITQVILESVLEAMDEVHSLMSKEKGLAGMAENVRQGYRAGGRAPRGYRLVKIETKTIRDGKPVTKSRLESDNLAPLVKRYMQGRAQGKSRELLRRQHNIKWPATSLIGMEWQALTYAGFTAWGMQCEKSPDGGYVGGRKRRPRSEWTISPEPTHEALISMEEAEAILSRLENSTIGQRVSEGKRGASAPLLTGYLVTADGRKWTADRKYYRLGDKYVKQEILDASVLAQIEAHLKSPASIRALIRSAQKSAKIDSGPIKRQLAALETKIGRTLDLAAQLPDPAPVARRVAELEKERGMLRQELVGIEREIASRKAVASISPAEVQALFTEREPRRLLHAVVSEITLNHDMSGQINYRLSMASPGGAERWPITAAAPFRFRRAV